MESTDQLYKYSPENLIKQNGPLKKCRGVKGNSYNTSRFPPCKVCGALPTQQTKKVENLGINVSFGVYPCDCYEQAEMAAEKKKKWNDHLKRSKIPPRYRAASLDYTGRSPYEKMVIPLCADYLNYISPYLDPTLNFTKTLPADTNSPGVLDGFGLIGDIGVGKTYFICAIELALLRIGCQCLFFNVPDFYDSLKRCFANSDTADKYGNLLDQAKETHIVAFDDIGAEYNTQWTVDELGKIINYRYNYGLITLFTSNLRANELENRIGKRATDRLKEMCRVHLITGDSLRGIKKKTKINL